jgi:hypothetical protein
MSMTPIDPMETRRLLDEIVATSNGRLLEDLVTGLFTAIPGLILRDRDRLSASGNEELDLAFSNSADPAGLAFFDRDLLVECKSQGEKVDAQAVNWFATKLRRRQQPLGVLVALAGVTGRTEGPQRAAQAEVELSASEGQQILVVVADELAGLQSGEHFANLLTLKRQRLVSGRQMLITTDDELAKLSPIPELPDSARLLLHPASNLAGAQADAWRLALDAGRLQLRRHRQRVLAQIDRRRPVLDPELRPGVDGVMTALSTVQTMLVEVESSIENDEPEDDVLGLVVETAAACIDLLRLDPAASGAPEPDVVAINVETFAPARLAAPIGSEYWALLTRYYLRQIEQVREQLREAAMYALLSLLVDQVLVLEGNP